MVKGGRLPPLYPHLDDEAYKFVDVSYQHVIRTNTLADGAAAAVIVIEVNSNLHFEVFEAELQVLVAQRLHELVTVPQPSLNITTTSVYTSVV